MQLSSFSKLCCRQN